ncbi:hypothetical protein ACFO3I_03135 [Rheinheimera marina]|uniref:Uncharacterized protein n=1 Tax=Rheinheimera marina TaxID=1774958 RepID=A0ABV9JI73_9GAMM
MERKCQATQGGVESQNELQGYARMAKHKDEQWTGAWMPNFFTD